MTPESSRPDDLCAASLKRFALDSPHAPPLVPSSVWRCDDPDQAEAVLGGERPGYVYQRDGHPNADWLVEKLNALHGAASGAVTASGMAALALALVSFTKPGDSVWLSLHVYGKTLQLLYGEGRRWGLRTELFDPWDPQSARRLEKHGVKLIVLESISNPRLRVADVAFWAEAAHQAGARLLIDNTLASPVLFRPLEWGADLVVESLTKVINGHSDLTLGYLGTQQESTEPLRQLCSTWGWTASPWDCWLALRGLGTLSVRLERAVTNALHIARWLALHPKVRSVDYPGLPHHPDHSLAQRQFGGRFGTLVTFHLWGDRAAATRLIRAVSEAIPFCPSLGELSTTLSHPESTSHRAMSGAQRAALGITGGTIRLSCGIESAEWIERQLAAGLEAV
ncbi:MAG: cystathionine gamma-synthase [Pirellulaceae bacterium]|nr:MAG: cystathionine gamma-synthase [Pirellulaceae bacterium]